MFLNIFLAFVILAETLGFSQSQEKILFLNSQNTPKKEINVLGKKSLPEVDINSIAPYPINKSNMEQAQTDAKSAIILDQKSNKIIYQKNITESHSIASITKLMTAIVLEEDFDLNEDITVTSQAAFIGGSVMGLYPGEVIKANELVRGMIIASANDAAHALEEHFGKEKLVEKMNQKAQFLDMKNTHYVEASGLDSNNKSNIRDLIILTRYALENQKMSEMMKTITYTALSTDGSLQHQIQTTNRLLKNYPDIIGVKTGYTEEAGSCLIAAAERDNNSVISIVLGMDNYDRRFSESRDLLDWAFNNYKWQNN